MYVERSMEWGERGLEEDRNMTDLEERELMKNWDL